MKVGLPLRAAPLQGNDAGPAPRHHLAHSKEAEIGGHYRKQEVYLCCIERYRGRITSIVDVDL
jgi:hypothetical protein